MRGRSCRKRRMSRGCRRRRWMRRMRRRCKGGVAERGGGAGGGGGVAGRGGGVAGEGAGRGREEERIDSSNIGNMTFSDYNVKYTKNFIISSSY